MSHPFPSQEWCDAYKAAINASAAYKEAGKEWTHGVVAMVVKADPAVGIPEELGMWLDVHQGECRACTLVSSAEAQNAAYVIVAPLARWKEVMKGEIDPIKSMMQNKLKLTKGHMPTMVKYVNASRELVAASSKVATKYPDE
jgi:putative sterol carrier protein